MSAPNAYRRSVLAFALASATLIAGAGAYAAHERAEGKQAGAPASPATVKAEADLKSLGQPEDRLASR